ncbi:YihY/virulence factor BrkB family protein [Halorubellus sp. PRR65]|uniref:YihY/virulence factor BrkB family protein n=1 Tax=Halorubellus sp. PRR65 TaxID=3098148 RepID=UPI002B262D4D|nr:YihY/virulence factor BrkB family protein [Halorubellus sp. PRR65]
MSAPTEAVARARRADVSFVAAAVAYYWLGSLVPVLALGFVAVQLVYGGVLADVTLTYLDGVLTADGRSLLRRALVDSRGATGLGAVGVLGLLWGWSRLYAALEAAFERVYETTADDGLAARALAGAVVVPAISIGMALAASGLLTTSGGLTWQVLHVVAVALALFPVFVTLPPTRPGLRAAILGASTTAVAWSALRFGFEVYAAYGSYSPAYGVIGGLILVVTSLYLGALALLVAVALTATLDA